MDAQSMSVRFPRDLHETLRKTAYEQRRAMNEIVTTAVRRDLDGLTPDQYAQLCGLFEAAWHHNIPGTLDDVPPMTSKEARSLALLAAEVMDRD